MSSPSQSFTSQIPDGDDRPRLVCQDCGFINYVNPRVVVGAVSVWEDRILMARRAIEPRHGFWTVPAGFMETGESLAEGAARETREEALASITVKQLLGVFDVAHISQVHMMFLADMTVPDHAPGSESLETALMSFDEIPWNELAFPSVARSLEAYRGYRDGSVELPVQQALPAMQRQKP